MAAQPVTSFWISCDVGDLRARDALIRVEHVTAAQEAVELTKSWLEPGGAVLIKGSNASGMARIRTALRKTGQATAGPQKASGA